MAYYAGFKLGGVQFSSITLGLAAQAAGWAIMMPLLTILAERLNGMRPTALMLAAEEQG